MGESPDQPTIAPRSQDRPQEGSGIPDDAVLDLTDLGRELMGQLRRGGEDTDCTQ